MTNRLRSTTLALFLAASAATSCHSTPPAAGYGPAVDRRAEEAALRAADLAWSEAAVKHDLEGIVSFMADDGETLAPNEPLAAGKAAIRASWQGLLALPDVRLSWQPVRVQVAASGELGFSRGTYTMSFTGPDGKTVKDEGKYVEVWKKVDGRWKCLIDSYSSNLPLQ